MSSSPVAQPAVLQPSRVALHPVGPSGVNPSSVSPSGSGVITFVRPSVDCAVGCSLFAAPARCCSAACSFRLQSFILAASAFRLHLDWENGLWSVERPNSHPYCSALFFSAAAALMADHPESSDPNANSVLQYWSTRRLPTGLSSMTTLSSLYILILWRSFRFSAAILFSSRVVEKSSGGVTYVVVLEGLCGFSVQELFTRGTYYTARVSPLDMTNAGFEKLVDDASKFLNDKVTKAVVTAPAYFSDSQRTATNDIVSRV